jgi:NADH:ubiquinone oxidoreductase subunit E
VCEQVKDYLTTQNKYYHEMPMDGVDGIVELRVNQVFAINAPVVQIDDHFYYDKTFEEYKSVLDKARTKT